MKGESEMQLGKWPGSKALFGLRRTCSAHDFRKKKISNGVLNEIYFQNFFTDKCNFSRRI